MARQITYEPVKLKQDIMTLFWAKGYAETSLSDLEAATGLNRRQLYNGIGDKHSMFLQAMDDFMEASGQTLLAPLEQESAGVTDIVQLFDKFVTMARDVSTPNGCMVCSASQDQIALDPMVSERMNAFFDRIRSAHFNALTRAGERGEIGLDDAEREHFADALYGVHVALCILGRAGRPESQLRHIAEQVVAELT